MVANRNWQTVGGGYAQAAEVFVTDDMHGPGVASVFVVGDPNGTVSGTMGQLAIDRETGDVYQNADSGTTWTPFGGGGGGVGPGNTNQLARFTAPTAVGDSAISDTPGVLEPEERGQLVAIELAAPSGAAVSQFKVLGYGGHPSIIMNSSDGDTYSGGINVDGGEAFSLSAASVAVSATGSGNALLWATGAGNVSLLSVAGTVTATASGAGGQVILNASADDGTVTVFGKGGVVVSSPLGQTEIGGKPILIHALDPELGTVTVNAAVNMTVTGALTWLKTDSTVIGADAGDLVGFYGNAGTEQLSIAAQPGATLADKIAAALVATGLFTA